MFVNAPPGRAVTLARSALPQVADIQGIDTWRQMHISHLVPYFGIYLRHEWQLAPETAAVYVRNLGSIVRLIGDIAPEEISPTHVLRIKEHALSRNAGPSRIVSLLAALKAFLRFCRESMGMHTMDATTIRGPRLRRRDVLFLRPEEVQKFVDAILPDGKHIGLGARERLCFRALVEVILGTGMRLSEALSLQRSSINFETGEASVVGKGNKERTVFFSVRALQWLQTYLLERTDTKDAVFFCAWGKPLLRHTAILWFRWFWWRSGVKKKITAHVLRHTVATTLLFNGCSIGHVKEILGHERLQTTCAYYLGTDKRAAKAAYLRCLRYDLPRTDNETS